MSNAKLTAAKEFLKEQDYGAARMILESMPEDDTAQRWLAQMGSRGKNPTPVRQGARGSRRNLIVVGVVCLVLGWAAGNSGQRAATQQQGVAAQATRTVAVVQSTPSPAQPTQTPQPTQTSLPTAVPQPIHMSGRSDTVVGPQTFAAGLYRVTARTDGFIIVMLTATDGICYEGTNSFFTTGGLFNLMSGQAVDGAETLMTSEGCTALIEVSNVQGDWELKFEKIG